PHTTIQSAGCASLRKPRCGLFGRARHLSTKLTLSPTQLLALAATHPPGGLLGATSKRKHRH
ncbi:MAG: hypothetical protein KAT70_02010, partial [Thermoplasmata archaeon]|nr:hypothetical protein [Thermoplasmata archaeon]